MDSSVADILGLCCVPTLARKNCGQRPIPDLPCCQDHVSHWATENFDNLRRFITLRADQVDRIYLSGSHRTVIQVRKLRGASLVPRRWGGPTTPGCTGLFLDADTAAVCADLLASLGNEQAAEIILTVRPPYS